MQKLLITLMFIMGVTMAHAAHEHEPETKTYDFFWSNIPAVCSSHEEIQRWATDKGFEPISMSYGRDNGQPDGEVRYIVVYWLNTITNESMASVSIPNDPTVCIVFRTFDLVINQQLYQEKL